MSSGKHRMLAGFATAAVTGGLVWAAIVDDLVFGAVFAFVAFGLFWLLLDDRSAS